MRECELCLIKHASPDEEAEVHEATASVHQYLRDRMHLVTHPVAIVAPPTKPKELRPQPTIVVKRHGPGYVGRSAV